MKVRQRVCFHSSGNQSSRSERTLLFRTVAPHEDQEIILHTNGRGGVNINAYPAIKEHLAKWRTELEPKPDDWDARREWLGRKKGSYRWYEIQDDVAYFVEFEKPKMIYPEIAMEPRFAYDKKRIYVNNKVFLIPLDDLYLLGVLNSSPAWDYAKTSCAVLGDENQGGRVMLQWVNFKKLPIPEGSSGERATVASLVQKCLNAKGVGCEGWEKEINERIAALYGL